MIFFIKLYDEYLQVVSQPGCIHFFYASLRQQLVNGVVAPSAAVHNAPDTNPFLTSFWLP